MKSKKRSATKPRPEPVVFFIDRSLGRVAGMALREAGASVEFHDDHFAPDAPDVEWLAEAGVKDWVVITKDKRIRRRPLEREAVCAAKLRVFVVAATKNRTGDEIAAILVKHRHRMERLAHKHEPPFIAGIYEDEVKLYALPEAEKE